MLLQVGRGEHIPAPRLPPSITRCQEAFVLQECEGREPNTLKQNTWLQEGSDRSSDGNLNTTSCSNYWSLVFSAV